MNYIHQLKADLASKDAALKAFKDCINNMRIFLNSDKFTGTESDGERKDWIATGDVLSMLWSMESSALHHADFAKANYKPKLTSETVTNLNMPINAVWD